MFHGYTCIGFGTFFNLLVRIGAWRVVKHVNDWCFRGINNGGLWEEDLHYSALQVSGSSYKITYPLAKVFGLAAKTFPGAPFPVPGCLGVKPTAITCFLYVPVLKSSGIS